MNREVFGVFLAACVASGWVSVKPLEETGPDFRQHRVRIGDQLVYVEHEGRAGQHHHRGHAADPSGRRAPPNSPSIPPRFEGFACGLGAAR
jgi:hypothetical protein